MSENEKRLASALRGLLRAVTVFAPESLEAIRAYSYPVKEARFALSRHERAKANHPGTDDVIDDDRDPADEPTDLELITA